MGRPGMGNPEEVPAHSGIKEGFLEEGTLALLYKG